MLRISAHLNVIGLRLVFEGGGSLNKKVSKSSSKQYCPIKNHSDSERAEDGLSSYAFISISNFFTKIDFFEGGALRIKIITSYL
jgi:hypothetical protein